jgi:hypothetical protein
MVTIHLSDSTAAALSVQALAAGLSLEAYLERIHGSGTAAKQIGGEEFERLVDAEAAPGPAYDGTYSRSEIYQDHD